MDYLVQNNAWMDESLMHEWISKVWQPYVNSKNEAGRFLLFLDEFGAHKCPSVLLRLANLRMLVEIVPAGYTSKLQVIDVGINRPFKRVYSEEHFAELMTFSARNVAGTKFNSSRQEVAKWIATAWDAVSKQTIVKTWQQVGIKLCTSVSESEVQEDTLQTKMQLGMESVRNGY